MTATIRPSGGARLPLSAGFVLHNEQFLKTPRQVVHLAIDQVEGAMRVRRRCLLLRELANEPVILRHNAFQPPAKLTEPRQ